MHVEYSNKYLKATSRLSAKLIALADTKEILFRLDPFHPALKTHRLHGKEKDAWAFSITQKYRIKFIFLSDTVVLFLDIGTHDEVYR